jgi:DUF1365 family protein
VRHRRAQPRAHEFRYRMFQLYLDLDELPTLFDGAGCGRSTAPTWRSCAARLLRRPALPLADAVRARVQRETGTRPIGPIRLLTHWRYFG